MLFSSADALRQFLVPLKQQDTAVGFVPTMGALHDGHISLIRASMAENKVTVVSIFVNPTQFNNTEDLEKYPRNIDKDIQLLEQEVLAGEDISHSDSLHVFFPSVDDVYGHSVQSAEYDFGSLTTVMEGRHRPGHFDGVATIVEYFLRLVRPDRAYFGEKDYQQLQVIRKLVADKGIPTEIRPMPIQREENGLAMSSRNGRLSKTGFSQASFIYEVLQQVQSDFKNKSVEQLYKMVDLAFAKNNNLSLEYFEIAEEDTLLPLKTKENTKAARAFIVAHIEGVRLIDNVAMKP